MTAPKPKLRWFQYSLRTLLVFVTLCAIACSWLGVKLRQAKREREAAAAIEKLGGTVDWSAPSGPVWLRSLLGNDFFVTVFRVQMYCTYATDTDLEHIKSLNQLRELYLYETEVTDAGLENLRRLNRLQKLSLANTKITDAGLEHLKGLTELKELWLFPSNVTDEGVKQLQHALPNCQIRH